MAQSYHVQCCVGLRLGSRHESTRESHRDALLVGAITPVPGILSHKACLGINTGARACQRPKQSRRIRRSGSKGSAAPSDDANKVQELLAINEQLRKRVEELEAAMESQSRPATVETEDVRALSPEAQAKSAAEAEEGPVAPEAQPEPAVETSEEPAAPKPKPKTAAKTIEEPAAPEAQPEPEAAVETGSDSPKLLSKLARTARKWLKQPKTAVETVESAVKSEDERPVAPKAQAETAAEPEEEPLAPEAQPEPAFETEDERPVAPKPKAKRAARTLEEPAAPEAKPETVAKTSEPVAPEAQQETAAKTMKEPVAREPQPETAAKIVEEPAAPGAQPETVAKTSEPFAPEAQPETASKTTTEPVAPEAQPEPAVETETEQPVAPEAQPETAVGSAEEPVAPEAQPEAETPPTMPKIPAEEAEHKAPSKERSKAKSIEWPSPSDPVPFWERPVTPLAGDAAKLGDGGVSQDPNPMHIVHVTAEMAPLAKVGGLGDVVTGLARACLARGHRVEVLLPFYECIDTSQVTDLQPGEEYNSFHRGGWVNLQVFRGGVSGVPVIFFKPANHFFRGGRIYGGSYDELEAYLFFSRAVLEYFQVMGQQPDVIHIHEWHTSGVALLYWDMYNALGLTRPRIALTIHNMEHHGECRREQLDMCGLDGSSYLVGDKAIDDRTIGHNPERGSLLKGGIVYSNVVTTVSPTYAEETLCSGWLASALMRHRGKYHGVLNGIDTVLWDPERDPHLPATFSADDLEGKRIVKHYVQRGLGLAPDLQTDPSSTTGFSDVATRQPLVVCVTRLVAQKGVHLIRHAIFRTAEQGGQFVLLGSAPDPRIQAEFQQLAEQFRDNTAVRLLLTYSESLAHLLFAAADVLLVPSMFEPCGLTQMIAMRYGTIPVVRRTGGLADTVFDVDNEADKERANGYVFDGIGEGDLNSALDRALRHYKENPEEWDRLASKVMKIDNSWNKSAGQYVELYSAIRA